MCLCADITDVLQQFLHGKEVENELEIAKKKVLHTYNINSGSLIKSDHGQKINRVREILVNFLRRTDRILSRLFEKRALTSQEYHLIQEHSTPHELAEHLLDVLILKDVSAYQCFLAGLDETNQHHLQRVLEDEGSTDINYYVFMLMIKVLFLCIIPSLFRAFHVI